MKKNNQPPLHLLILALIIAAALLAVPASALKVEGARIALDVESGQTYTYPIGISLSADESGGSYAVDVMGLGQSPVDGATIPLEPAMDTNPYTARPFITIDTSTVTLNPGEKVEVTATISIPSGTRDGGRYAIILVHPAGSATGAPASFATAVAIPVVLTVKAGTISETGEITSIEPNVAEAGKSLDVVTTFRNSGNYHYYWVRNNLTVTDADGKEVDSIRTEPFTRAIIPGQSVKFIATIDSGLPQGNYQVTSRMEKQDGELLAAKTATLQIGNPASVQASTQATQGNTGSSIPGFGSIMAILGLAGALCGIFWHQKRAKG